MFKSFLLIFLCNFLFLINGNQVLQELQSTKSHQEWTKIAIKYQADSRFFMDAIRAQTEFFADDIIMETLGKIFLGKKQTIQLIDSIAEFISKITNRLYNDIMVATFENEIHVSYIADVVVSPKNKNDCAYTTRVSVYIIWDKNNKIKKILNTINENELSSVLRNCVAFPSSGINKLRREYYEGIKILKNQSLVDYATKKFSKDATFKVTGFSIINGIDNIRKFYETWTNMISIINVVINYFVEWDNQIYYNYMISLVSPYGQCVAIYPVTAKLTLNEEGQIIHGLYQISDADMDYVLHDHIACVENENKLISDIIISK